MYSIQKVPNILSARKSIDQTTSLGLGITLLQLGFDLHKFSQFVYSDDENYINTSNLDENGHRLDLDCGTETKEGEFEKNTSILPCSKSHHSSFSQQEFGRWFFLGVILYLQLFLVVVDTYLYRFLRHATHKENIGNCWLGLYLQISLLSYNVAEILIVAHSGVFDGSSILLAGRVTVRAISIEVIYLFLRQIEDKQETDAFMYIILIV